MSASPALTVPLDSIAPCFEGVVPASVCSCSLDGTPNVTFLSIVHRLDASHVGLSFQFFNKTRKNTQENPQTQVILVAPGTADQYRLDLRYLRTETDGPAFDRMHTRLEAIASQSARAYPQQPAAFARGFGAPCPTSARDSGEAGPRRRMHPAAIGRGQPGRSVAIQCGEVDPGSVARTTREEQERRPRG